MKKIFIAATVILLATASLQAQAQKEVGTEKHHRGAYGHKGMKQLNLNDDQKKQVKDIREGYHKQFTDLKNNKSLSADEIKTRSAALRKEQHEKMQSLLTPDQKSKMVTWKKDGAADMNGHRQNFDRLKTDLGLNDEQAAKIKAGQTGFREKAKAIHENPNLTDTQKRDQMKEMARQQRENMKSILTPGQLEKMKTGRKARGVNSKK